MSHPNGHTGFNMNTENPWHPVHKALQILQVHPALKSLLIQGELGYGKSTILHQTPAYFPQLPSNKIPAHLQLEACQEQIDWSRSLQQKHAIMQPGILTKISESLVLMDDIQRMDSLVLRMILQSFQNPFCHGKLVASILFNPQEDNIRLSPSLYDLFDLCITLSFHPTHTPFPTISSPLSIPYSETNVDTKPWLEKTCQEVTKAGCPGHRAEKVWLQTAESLALCDNQSAIHKHHWEQARFFAVEHREIQNQIENDLEQKTQQPLPENPSDWEKPSNTPQTSEQKDSSQAKDFSSETAQCQNIPMPPLQPWLGTLNLQSLHDAIRAQALRGKRSWKKVKQNRSQQNKHNSPVIGSQPTPNPRDPHWPATLRQALPWQHLRGRQAESPLQIHAQDWRDKKRQHSLSVAHVLVIDASGSMGGSQRLHLGQALFQELLDTAYPHKERVALLVFTQEALKIQVALGSRWNQAQETMKDLSCRGRSPLHHMINACADYAQNIDKQHHEGMPNWIILSDFRPNFSKKHKQVLGSQRESPIEALLQSCRNFAKIAHPKIILDAETGPLRLGLAQQAAQAMKAQYFHLNDFEE